MNIKKTAKAWIKKLFFSMPVYRPFLWRFVRAVWMTVPIWFFIILNLGIDGSEGATANTHVFCATYQPAWIAAMLVVISLVLDVYEQFTYYLHDRRKPPGTLDYVLAALNRAVATKLQRFAEEAKKIKTSAPNQSRKSSEVFLSITQPQKQMTVLIEQLHSLLVLETNDRDLATVLWSVENGKTKKVVACGNVETVIPDGVAKQLTGNNSSFCSYVAKNRHPVCISNIPAHLSKLKSTPSAKRKDFIPFKCAQGADNGGSICGFPVFNPHFDRVSYVLTVKSKNIKVLTDSFVRKYTKVVFEPFISRIRLEDCLAEIRSRFDIGQ